MSMIESGRGDICSNDNIATLPKAPGELIQASKLRTLDTLWFSFSSGNSSLWYFEVILIEQYRLSSLDKLSDKVVDW